MNTFVDNQNWRYATKKFDASKKVSTEDLNILKEAIRLLLFFTAYSLTKLLLLKILN